MPNQQCQSTKHLFSVHIVAQQVNRYIMAFHIAISYDIYLSAGDVDSGHISVILVTLVVMCCLQMCPWADMDNIP